MDYSSCVFKGCWMAALRKKNRGGSGDEKVIIKALCSAIFEMANINSLLSL